MNTVPSVTLAALPTPALRFVARGARLLQRAEMGRTDEDASGRRRDRGEWMPAVGAFLAEIDAEINRRGRDQAQPEANGHANHCEALVVSEAGLARAQGYEADPCPDCLRMTLVRRGTCLTCDFCGSTTGCG